MTGEIRQLRFAAQRAADRLAAEEVAAIYGIEAVAAAHPDQTVVVVSHVGTIGQALAEASGSRPLAFAPDNGSISEIVVSGDGWALRRFNDVGHLDGR